MTAATPTPSRRLFVPEIIQSSAMDCGPACLKALLEGFGIAVNYSRLREACQTDVDGTSIDAIEDVAVSLGLSAAQYIVPTDHLFMPETEAIPAMVVTQHPNGLTHFVVAWRTHQSFVQVMDPAAGRLFQSQRRFLRDVYVHRFPVARSVANEWLNAPAFLEPLRRRMAALRLSAGDINDLLTRAAAADDWLPLAAIDAATRLSARLVEAGAISPETSAADVVMRLSVEAARRGAEHALKIIPPAYWSVGALPNGNAELRGAVIVHVAGKTEADGAKRAGDAARAREPPASPELAAAIGGDQPRPLRAILRAALAEFGVGLVALPLALILAGVATGLSALVFSSFIGVGGKVGAGDAISDPKRTLWVIAAFLAASALLSLSTSAIVKHLGRWVDLHFRMRLLEKLPRLGNYYFHSRLMSDLTQRAHELQSLRGMPALVGGGIQIAAEILLTTVGVLWLVEGSAIPMLLAVVILMGLPLALFPWMREQDLRRETHAGVLIRFHLDSLLGLMPIRAHRAEQAVRAEHEALLVKWAAAVRQFYWTHLGGLAVSMFASTLVSFWVASRLMGDEKRSALTLLLAYWVIKLPSLAQSLAGTLQQLPALDNRFARLFDVLTGPEEDELYAAQPGAPPPESVEGAPAPALRAKGVHVVMRGVGVQAAGHTILSDIDLEIQPGEHVAVVGPSGSGKTSLVGLLLGWHRAAAGSVFIDGDLAQAEPIRRLRRMTAWVDPAVQLWNRSLDQNVRYGNEDHQDVDAARSAAESADLAEVIARLPKGMESSLGEGGALVSAGEGQRVRFARALLREGVRLAILDEPFRGLARDKRIELLGVARRAWRDATLIYVSHDINTALDFDRVLVVDGGQIVEDGAPSALLERPDSRFRALKEAEEALHEELWRSPVWRRFLMERGALREVGDKRP